MAAKEIIATFSPELSEHSAIDNFIAIADAQTSKNAFGNVAIGTLGSKRDYAVALRAMHLMENSSSNKEGMVLSETEGELSRTYAVSQTLSKKYPDLVTTKWGRMLAEYIDSNVFPAITRMSR